MGEDYTGRIGRAGSGVFLRSGGKVRLIRDQEQEEPPPPPIEWPSFSYNVKLIVATTTGLGYGVPEYILGYLPRVYLAEGGSGAAAHVWESSKCVGWTRPLVFRTTVYGRSLCLLECDEDGVPEALQEGDVPATIEFDYEDTTKVEVNIAEMARVKHLAFCPSLVQSTTETVSSVPNNYLSNEPTYEYAASKMDSLFLVNTLGSSNRSGKTLLSTDKSMRMNFTIANNQGRSVTLRFYYTDGTFFDHTTSESTFTLFNTAPHPEITSSENTHYPLYEAEEASYIHDCKGDTQWLRAQQSFSHVMLLKFTPEELYRDWNSTPEGRPPGANFAFTFYAGDTFGSKNIRAIYYDYDSGRVLLGSIFPGPYKLLSTLGHSWRLPEDEYNNALIPPVVGSLPWSGAPYVDISYTMRSYRASASGKGINAIKAMMNVTLETRINSDEEPTELKVVYNPGTYGVLPTPVWEGHTFSGWYYRTLFLASEKIEPDTPVLFISDHTLYARWDNEEGAE